MNIDFKQFSSDFAKEINGQYTEYDETTSLFILRLEGARYQMVVARVFDHPAYNRKALHISSKICSTKANIKFFDLLESNHESMYTRFIIEEDYLKVEASAFLKFVEEEVVKEMILEVANTADEWERKITGKDIN